jgi:hypothetical protein
VVADPGQDLQAVAHALGTRLATDGGDRDAAVEADPRPATVARRNDDQHALDALVAQHRLDGVLEHGACAEHLVLLGHRATEPRAAAGGRDQGEISGGFVHFGLSVVRRPGNDAGDDVCSGIGLQRVPIIASTRWAERIPPTALSFVASIARRREPQLRG